MTKFECKTTDCILVGNPIVLEEDFTELPCTYCGELGTLTKVKATK